MQPVQTWAQGRATPAVATLGRVERLRASAHRTDAGPRPAAELVVAAEGDGAAVQAAWATFVPYLAHPVMADAARSAMTLLDAATIELSAPHSAAM